jgi:phosphatidylserine/phosphatidylglycerophosphate/cardiolipin synthase-like enzyme
MTRRRRRSKRQDPLAILIGLVLLILVAVASRFVPDALPTGLATFTPAPPTPVVVAAGGDWYRLYFTTPEQTAALDQPSGGIPERIAESIHAARQSVDVAVYEFDLLPLAEALLDAHGRGVRVRLVTDTDTLGDATVESLAAAGVPVVADGRDPFMHHKFVVVDGASVWTGSMNFTRNDAYRNDNVVIQVNSVRLAENYTHEFEEMFSARRFGPNSPADTPHPLVTLDGTRVASYFSPDDGVAAHLLDVLAGAQRSLYFMAFAFTRVDFADALLERAAAGVDVRGVFETRQIAAGGDQAWIRLTEGGLAEQVRQDGNPYNLHSKVIVVDESIAILGSYNFSRNAEESNDENVLIIFNADIARALVAEWQRVWAQAG